MYQVGADLPLDIEPAVHDAPELLLQPFDFGAELAPLAQELALAALSGCRLVEGMPERDELGAVDIGSDEPSALSKAQLLVVQQRELVGRRVALWQAIPGQPAVPYTAS